VTQTDEAEPQGVGIGRGVHETSRDPSGRFVATGCAPRLILRRARLDGLGCSGALSGLAGYGAVRSTPGVARGRRLGLG
jgi:hypothetical protein